MRPDDFHCFSSRAIASASISRPCAALVPDSAATYVMPKKGASDLGLSESASENWIRYVRSMLEGPEPNELIAEPTFPRPSIIAWHRAFEKCAIGAAER